MSESGKNEPLRSLPDIPAESLPRCRRDGVRVRAFSMQHLNIGRRVAKDAALIHSPHSMIDQMENETAVQKKCGPGMKPLTKTSLTTEHMLPSAPKEMRHPALILAGNAILLFAKTSIGSMASVQSLMALIRLAENKTGHKTAAETHFPSNSFKRKSDGDPHWKIVKKKKNIP